MSDTVALSTESILNANVNVLEKNFRFIVNGQPFETNKFTASILSPVVSNLLSADLTVDSYEINTSSKGDFEEILNLLCFQKPISITSPIFNSFLRFLKYEKIHISKFNLRQILLKAFMKMYFGTFSIT